MTAYCTLFSPRKYILLHRHRTKALASSWTRYAQSEIGRLWYLQGQFVAFTSCILQVGDSPRKYSCAVDPKAIYSTLPHVESSFPRVPCAIVRRARRAESY